MPKENLPIVAGITVTTDAIDRFNLNAIHKASGEGEHKRPSKWLATAQSQELITELEASLLKNSQSPNSGFAHNVIEVKHGGKNPGTYAHEILAVEYAGWIRPDFRIRVNQTFIDYRRGKLTKETPKRQPHRDEGSGLPEFRKAKAMQMAMEVAEKTFAWATLLSPLSRQGVIAGLINPLAGCEVVPLPLLVEKLYTASEIGKLFDVSANKIGRIANDNNMKSEQYGQYHLDKSRHIITKEGECVSGIPETQC
ncbi:KilA-N domain-containing protein [Candidatus Regiella endosymbiont of Tuberolachnus salignus]